MCFVCVCVCVVGLPHIQKHTPSNAQNESVFESTHIREYCLNEKISTAVLQIQML